MKKPFKKNLTDKDMLAGYEEESTFETELLAQEEPVPKAKSVSKNTAPSDFKSAFFSSELQEDVGKALLELKVKLYKEGILDYKLKVLQEGRQVIITALPASQVDKLLPNRKEKKS